LNELVREEFLKKYLEEGHKAPTKIAPAGD